MSTVVITPPEGYPVSLDDVKTQLSWTGNSKDDLIQALIAAATAHIDGPSGLLGRSLITQTLETRFDEFCSDDMRLLCPDVQEIVSVKYDDATGAEQTVDSSKYRLVYPNILGLTSGSTWPTAFSQTGAVRVQYISGYGDGAVDVPAPIRQAIILAVRQQYDVVSRNAFLTSDVVNGVGSKQYTFGNDAQASIQMATDSLLSPYRVIF